MAPKTMKAAICKQAGGPIVIEEVDVPSPSDRHVLIKLVVASLCNTDVNVIDGNYGPNIYPVVLGHEAIGRIEELGPDADAFGLKIGQIIGAPPYTQMCLDCYDCRHYGPDFCPQKKVKGITAPGYFSEYSLIDAASAVILSDDVGSGRLNAVSDIRLVSPLFCAGITVWDALERSKIAPGETVAVFGAGGLGQLAVRYASALGGKVIALDVQDDQLQASKGPGLADDTINIAKADNAAIAAKLRSLNNGRGAGAVLVTAGAPAAYSAALAVVEPLGRVVAIGLPKNPVPIHPAQLSATNTTIVGARIPGQACAQRCIDFSFRRDIFAPVNQREFKLEDINEMVALMKEGKVAEGRMVVRF